MTQWNERNLIDKLSARRAVLALDAELVARRIGVCSKQVYAWESGIRHPNLTNLIAWAQVLGLRVDLIHDSTLDKRVDHIRMQRARIGRPIPQELLDQLRSARKEQGMNMLKLGKKLGVTNAMIGYYESGKRRPSLVRLQVWGTTLGVDVGAVLILERR